MWASQSSSSFAIRTNAVYPLQFGGPANSAFSSPGPTGTSSGPGGRCPTSSNAARSRARAGSGSLGSSASFFSLPTDLSSSFFPSAGATSRITRHPASHASSVRRSPPIALSHSSLTCSGWASRSRNAARTSARAGSSAARFTGGHTLSARCPQLPGRVRVGLEREQLLDGRLPGIDAGQPLRAGDRRARPRQPGGVRADAAPHVLHQCPLPAVRREVDEFGHARAE